MTKWAYPRGHITRVVKQLAARPQGVCGRDLCQALGRDPVEDGARARSNLIAAQRGGHVYGAPWVFGHRVYYFDTADRASAWQPCGDTRQVLNEARRLASFKATAHAKAEARARRSAVIGSAVASRNSPPPRNPQPGNMTVVPARSAAVRARNVEPTVPPGLVVQRVNVICYDKRYQVDPHDRVFGAGFAAVGIGRDVGTGRPWA